MLEVDLSMFGDLELPTNDKELEAETEDNELGLPFKPHLPNSVAKEIDASIHSHSPLEYKLRKITLTKPDYSELIAKLSMSRIQLDPRLKRYAGNKPSTSTTSASVSSTTSTSNTSSSSSKNTKSKDPSPSPREDPRYVKLLVQQNTLIMFYKQRGSQPVEIFEKLSDKTR